MTKVSKRPRSYGEFLDQVPVLAANECWPWNGPRFEKGYGKYDYDGKQHRAHRVAYELFRGPIPHGKLVCHSCDNPPCVNPLHLWVGTQSDNLQDCHGKGRRNVAGEHNGSARLTGPLVAKIRERYMPRHPVNGCNALAREYGVSPCTISQTVNHLRWYGKNDKGGGGGGDA